jgi:hypothetical protein
LKRYCFDNSGFSNPHETMPEDIPIYAPLWGKLQEFVLSGFVAVTWEIYREMCHITGGFGQCINDNKDLLLMEVGDPSWDSLAYIDHYKRMQLRYHAYLSEYAHSGSKKTIGLKDLTIISLAKTLGLPVVSMEVTALPSPIKRRIPDICAEENVLHLNFNEFLRIEGIGS